MKARIFLVGYRCVGKSTVALHLARMLDVAWVDLDRKMEEHAGCSIEEFVQREGWEAFRELEMLTLQRVLEEDFIVVATGGGIVTRAENIRTMREQGLVFHLDAMAETIAARMEQDRKNGFVRPALKGVSALDEVKDIMAARAPLYAEAAHGTVRTDHLSPENVALEIVQALKQYLQ
ncbi:shikimate kinase [Desulfobotulus alkaliphilus]|uniref:Shikimate kinase n=1 Tax=Desulfobotulus alkaliphilus TaxID=622671 RepID=A0A562R9K9_9BACT|nr:shikimate kinase [Desulfobotulus alkaliphilus]TWI65738.1 shikimate kinase [Desulfobotulus alkaliphilus]